MQEHQKEQILFNAEHHNDAPIGDFKKALAFAKQRVDALDQKRIERTLSANSAEYQHVFLLLPLLLHFNSPYLPTYVEHAPEGIANFELSSYQQNYLRIQLNDKPLAKKSGYLPAFDGLYAMGSTSSISQTSLSDLDLWLCCSDELSPIDHKYLEQKIEKLTQWASYFDVVLNIYVMNPKQFKNQQYHTDISAEHSGSAQYYFLLDEFYRSAIRLAGKPLLWLHINNEDDRHYQAIIDTAVAKDELYLKDWIDFGGFSSLSASEFFGAGLWQLYKGINSPYKSAIKILLLEHYAENYSNTQLISKQFKQKLLSSENVDEYHFDPYLAMLEQVTIYLTERNELERLNRLRLCFYLKVNEGSHRDTWRRKKLSSLVKEWGWTSQEVALLDERPYWKVKQAVKHHQMLVEQLLQSYRHLIQFARKFHLDPSILPNDTDMLMRKLYSAFEVLPGKITLINPRITTNLAENAVTFVETKDGRSTESGWYLINQAPRSHYDSETRYVQHSKTLNQLVAWAFFNGIITASTSLHIVSESLDAVRLRQFMTDLRLSFPVQAPVLTNEDLHHPNEIRTLVVVANLVEDPTPDIQVEGKGPISASDLFNLSVSQKSLIGSIDIIYRNMWNEIRTQHFSGENAILKALKFIANKIYRGKAPPQSVNVFCYSQKLRGELRDFIANLVNKCISVQLGTLFQKQQQSSTIQVAGKTWQFIFEKEGIEFKEVPEKSDTQAVAFPASFAKKDDDQPACKMPFPREIDAFASEGFLQFFFEDSENDTFNVYILDEENRIESYYGCTGEKDVKIKEISRLYADRKVKNPIESESFCFPQYYQIIYIENQAQIVPFQSKKYRAYQTK